MILVFDITKIPRTTTRGEWKEMQRWARVTTKQLQRSEDAMIGIVRKASQEFVMFGQSTIPQEAIEDMLDKIINPPVLLGPHQ